MNHLTKIIQATQSIFTCKTQYISSYSQRISSSDFPRHSFRLAPMRCRRAAGRHDEQVRGEVISPILPVSQSTDPYKHQQLTPSQQELPKSLQQGAAKRERTPTGTDRQSPIACRPAECVFLKSAPAPPDGSGHVTACWWRTSPRSPSGPVRTNRPVRLDYAGCALSRRVPSGRFPLPVGGW